MTIKKLAASALIVTCTCLSMPSFSGTISPGIEINANTTNPKEADLLVRLKEIKEMDKSNLSRAERKDLRKELKQMKREVRDKKNGIYLSVGAIIVIIVLLLLLL